MNATEKRIFIPLLKRVLNDTINHGTKSTARYWLHRLQKPRSKPSAQRKEAKAAQHREGLQTKPEGLPVVAFPKPDGDADREKKREWAKWTRRAVYGVVAARATEGGGFCECGCGTPFLVYGPQTKEMDHFYGRHVETPEACWMLTRACHRRKTRNDPSRAEWDTRFRLHCDKHGYEFTARLVKSESAPRRSA